MISTKFLYQLSLSCLFALLIKPAFAQVLPKAMRFAADEHIIYTGDQPADGLYDTSQMRVFELWFSQPNYWQQMQNNYNSKTDLLALLVVDGDTFPNVGVRFKGQTSYSQVQNSEKKSFNITVDYLDPDQKLMGYGTINLNNCFQDASFMREVTYLNQIRKHIPAASANYVHLFINGSSWGIYPNIQQLNRDYIQEWYFSKNGTMWRADRPAGVGGPGGPGWGDGTAGLNNLGPDTSTYQAYYILKSTDKATPWDDLVQTCAVLNDTPLNDLEASIVDYLDLDRTLWFLASEIAFSDDDSYIYKGKMDYYLYWDPETGRMTPLEFDGNSVMKSNTLSWGAFYNETKVNYPLLNRLLAVPSIRQRYLAHFRTLIQDEMDESSFNALVDHIDAKIAASVMADPKKLYSNTQYNSEKQVIKNFVQNHKSTLLNHPEMGAIGPVISSVDMRNIAGMTWANPVDNQGVTVNASVSSTNGIAGVYAYFCPALYGNFTKIDMYDDGQHGDGASGDGVFGIDLPGYPTGTYVRFYIEAKSANAVGTLTYNPVGAEHNVYYYQVQAAWATDRPVAINEIMASNSSAAADENGDFDDWIELYNLTSNVVDLSGYYLSDDPSKIDKWAFPSGSLIAPNDYLIVWADEDGPQGPLHANFKLSASGESLTLADPSKKLVDTTYFGQQVTDKGYARVPNGTGPFLIQAPTFSGNNAAVATFEPAEADWFQVTPTLAKDYIQLQMNEPEPAQYQLLNMQGTVLQEGQFKSVKRLDITQLPSGTYMVTIRATGKQGTKRIICTK